MRSKKKKNAESETLPYLYEMVIDWEDDWEDDWEEFWKNQDILLKNYTKRDFSGRLGIV